MNPEDIEQEAREAVLERLIDDMWFSADENTSETENDGDSS